MGKVHEKMDPGAARMSEGRQKPPALLCGVVTLLSLRGSRSWGPGEASLEASGAWGHSPGSD